MKAHATGQPIRKNKFPHQIVNNVFSHNSDVGADGASSAAYVLVLIDVLNGAASAFGDYSTDVDRSGATTAAVTDVAAARRWRWLSHLVR